MHNRTKLTTEEFISRSTAIHSGKYNYSKTVYGKNITEKIVIICPAHGEFLQSATHHLRGMGCKNCGRNYRPSTQVFIESARQIHGDRYDYSKVDYKQCEEKVIIICKLHGEFKQRPVCHLNRSHGCPKCGIKTQSDTKRSTIETFIRRSRRIHGNLYNYSKAVYVNNETNLEIICKKHGSFFQSPASHLYQKAGCPKCNLSKAELKIIRFLKERRIDYITQKTFTDCRNPATNQKLKFDFYLPLKNILIEYDGPQHFEEGRHIGGYVSTLADLKSTQLRDKIKTNYAEQNGIELIRIKYTKFKKLNSILKESLKLSF